MALAKRAADSTPTWSRPVAKRRSKPGPAVTAIDRLNADSEVTVTSEDDFDGAPDYNDLSDDPVDDDDLLDDDLLVQNEPVLQDDHLSEERFMFDIREGDGEKEEEEDLENEIEADVLDQLNVVSENKTVD